MKAKSGLPQPLPAASKRMQVPVRDVLSRALQFGSSENLQPPLDSAFRSSVIKPPADENCRYGEHGIGEDSNRDCGHTNLLPDKAECRGGG